MRWFSITLFTAFISIGVAMLLSLLPDLNEQRLDASSAIEVKQTSLQQGSLSEHNLVDHIILLSPNLDIDRVDWNHSILSLDLSVSDNQATPKLIYEELIRINDLALRQMNNVKQVLVRVFYEMNEQEDSVLILAMGAPREQWSMIAFHQFENESISAKQFLNNFQMIYTKEWSKYFQEENHNQP